MEDSIRVLHVDDDPDFAEVTAEYLEREDDRLTVDTVTTPEEGLDRLVEADCVVSDYEMSGTDGVEFLRSVREQFPDLPYILFTGRGSEAVASEAISEGVTDYLRKEGATEQYTVLANRIVNAVERHRTEKELERQNDLFVKAQGVANVGAWAHDVERGKLLWTEQVYEMHGLPQDFDPTVERIEEFYHPEDRPELLEAVQRAATEGEPYDMEVRLIDTDGEQRWIRTVGDPQYEDGEIVRVRGIIHDITERKEREQELERQNERLEKFANVVSHDLRNPLNVAQLRIHGVDDENARHVRENLDRMESIIDDVLTFAREGRAVEETEQVDLSVIAGQSWEQVETGDATLSCGDELLIEADSARCKQLFENLFRNSIEHGGDDVTIRVGSVEGGFYIEDDGPGIPDDERAEVFEVGYTTNENGTGFGLSIVDQIAQAHGWRVDILDGTDGGARFEFVTQ